MPRYRYSLYKFIFEFEKGDYLIIPSSKKFSIFQIESDILDYNDKEIKSRIIKNGGDLEKIIKNNDDFRYFRKLKPIKPNLLRNEYAIGTLCSELKYRGTTKELFDEAKEDVKRAVESDKPISLYNDIINEVNEALLKKIVRITPEQFEKLIKWYFKKIDADESKILPKNYSAKAGKEDVDVEAVFHNLKLIIYVQAKRHLNRSDLTEANRQITAYKNKYDTEIDYSDYMKMYWIISTAEEANEEVVEKGIRVIKGKEFAEMLLNVGLSKDIDEVLDKE